MKITTVGVLALALGLTVTNSAHAVLISTTLDSLAETTLGNGSQGVYGTFDFEITNGTDSVWTDFHFYDAEPIGSVLIDTYVGPGTVSFNEGTFQFDIIGLNVGIGETLNFAIDEVCGIAEVCSLGGGIWRGMPTIDGIIPPPSPVPEPGTLAMLIAGLALVGLARRRRRSLALLPA